LVFNGFLHSRITGANGVDGSTAHTVYVCPLILGSDVDALSYYSYWWRTQSPMQDAAGLCTGLWTRCGAISNQDAECHDGTDEEAKGSAKGQVSWPDGSEMVDSLV